MTTDERTFAEQQTPARCRRALRGADGKALGVLLAFLAGGLAGGAALVFQAERVRAALREIGLPVPSGAASSGAAGAEGKKVLYWRSTMIPGEIKKQPGKDSMGMDMVPVYEGEDKAGASGVVKIDAIALQSSGVRFAKVTRGPVVRRVRAVGYVDYNEPKTAFVAPRVAGWIEGISVDTTGQEVHTGDPLFELYSPDLYAAQAEYVLALRRVKRAGSGPDAAAARSLLEQTKTRLRLFDVPEDQIQAIEKRGKPSRTVTIRSPANGIVTHKTALQGDYFKAGTRVYTISDISTVWVFAEVYERDLPFIALGQQATMRLSYLPGRTFVGRVTYVYPYLDPKTRTTRVRMEFHNPGYILKPGMYADIELAKVVVENAVLAPATAVLRSGERSTVFVWKGEGRFLPVQVELGLRGDGDVIQIRKGLKGGEQVALSGQFLIDSESQLQEAIRKMLEPPAPPPGPDAMKGMKGMKGEGDMSSHAGEKGAGKEGGDAPGAEHAGDHAGASSPAGAAAASVRFVCPMPAHAGILYDQGGLCPICGMPLIPARKRAGAPDSETLPVLFWTCPMPGHDDIREAKPGPCPRCGMTLIPVRGGPPKAAPTPSTPPGR